jgi:hypothetical protein
LRDGSGVPPRRCRCGVTGSQTLSGAMTVQAHARCQSQLAAGEIRRARLPGLRLRLSAVFLSCLGVREARQQASDRGEIEREKCRQPQSPTMTQPSASASAPRPSTARAAPHEDGRGHRHHNGTQADRTGVNDRPCTFCPYHATSWRIRR